MVLKTLKRKVIENKRKEIFSSQRQICKSFADKHFRLKQSVWMYLVNTNNQFLAKNGNKTLEINIIELICKSLFCKYLWNVVVEDRNKV